MSQCEDNALSGPLGESPKVIGDYRQAELGGLAPRTVDAYMRILRQVSMWLAARRGDEGRFYPEDLTEDAVATYLGMLSERDLSWSHRKRILAVLNQFCNWLIARGVLSSNPTGGVTLEAQPPRSAGGLSEAQRSIVRRLVGQSSGPVRGAAIFALGYWAGCSASEVSGLLLADVHLEPGVGWLRVGGSRRAGREIPLHAQARAALAAYLESGARFQTSAYLFTSQRETRPAPAGEPDGWRLGEAAIHEWWKVVKAGASEVEWPLVCEVTFLDLRHDFRRRAEVAGWQREELADYLGRTPRRPRSAGRRISTGSPPTRSDLERKVQLIRG